MIHAFTGDPLHSYINISSGPEGTPLTGLTWETVVSQNPLGASFAVSVVEIGSGVYRMEADTVYDSPEGEWYALVRSVEFPNRRFSETWDVNRKTSSAISGVYIDSPTGLSLREIRAMVARQLRDYRKVTAQAGSETTITDIFNLVENTDHFRGAEILCIQGAEVNVNQKRKVVSSRYETGTITFIPALDAPVAEGDVFELFNFARLPFTMQDIDNSINDAILSAYPQNREKLYADIPTPYSRIGAGVVIPDEFTHLYDVQVKVGEFWDQVAPGRFIGERGWAADRAQRLVILGGSYTWQADGKLVRLYGYGRSRILESDDQRTNTDIEWVLDTAVSTLITGMMDQASFPIGQSRANRADQLRAKMAKTPEPNTVSISG